MQINTKRRRQVRNFFPNNKTKSKSLENDLKQTAASHLKKLKSEV